MLKAGRIIHILFITAFALMLATALSGCRARSGAAGSKPYDGPGKRYDLKGRVVAVDKKGKQLIIAHEPISDYMPAMTMGFNVKNESDLDTAKPEDKIQATLIVENERSWLEDVILTRISVDPAATQPAKSLEPEPGSEVPDFTLVNQSGKPISINQYRGRALVLTFIYTRCPLPDYCPLMNENFAAIESELQKDARLDEKTHLISITVDPAYDTPQVLRRFGAAYAARKGRQPFAHWEFATGTSDEIKNIATFFGLQYWEEEGQITHSLRTAVISPEGKLIKLYRGNEWKPEEIINDLQVLKTDSQAQSLPALGSVYEVNGVIESVDKANGMVQINHEDIKGVMPGMNMPFKVKDPAMLDSIASGDKVRFSLQLTESGFLVLAINKL